MPWAGTAEEVDVGGFRARGAPPTQPPPAEYASYARLMLDKSCVCVFLAGFLLTRALLVAPGGLGSRLLSSRRLTIAVAVGGVSVVVVAGAGAVAEAEEASAVTDVSPLLSVLGGATS